MTESPPPRPRWVKLAGLVVLLVVVALVVGKLAGVEHGPGLHGSGGTTTEQPGGLGGHTPPEGVRDHGAPGQ